MYQFASQLSPLSAEKDCCQVKVVRDLSCPSEILPKPEYRYADRVRETIRLGQ